MPKVEASHNTARILMLIELEGGVFIGDGLFLSVRARQGTGLIPDIFFSILCLRR
jgi:hypothetical protein